jgi:dTDP-4-dehydrorhamnose 3,5-epimerase-like enzyme|tara:strand:+ start:1192 stop:1611 length:420 start_codon:yes stop_codon:yes gene_type:complete
MTTLKDVKEFNLKSFIEPDGKLTPIELDRDIPFDVKRMFYVYDVHDQNDRGKHSHHKTKQILIAVSGRVTVVCDDGKTKRNYVLDEPSRALYIPEMIWDEQIYHSEDSVLLVLANTNYDFSDYIEDYEKFKRLKKELYV